MIIENVYPVSMLGKPVGTVTVTLQGLYYYIQCSCSIASDSVCRLMVKNHTATHKIGILIPEGNEFQLKKSIPAKNLSISNPEFFISAGSKDDNRIFIPIRDDEPIEDLYQLCDCALGYQNGVIGVWVKNKQAPDL